MQTPMGFEDVPKGLVRFLLVFPWCVDFYFYFWGNCYRYSGIL